MHAKQALYQLSYILCSFILFLNGQTYPKCLSHILIQWNFSNRVKKTQIFLRQEYLIILCYSTKLE